ncbi:hypothetical protein BGX28_005803 [Mortierella sp. GBA30]|nr:hypothetical protein BGX28_005803 [Mortierella sp. GBA30]
MASTRPVRTSARQSAIRQQEQEALEAKEAARREQLALKMEQLARQKEQEQQEQQERERELERKREKEREQELERASSTSSSRSLSPALSDSDSDSLSSGDDGEDDSDEGSNEEKSKKKTSASSSSNWTLPPSTSLSSSWEVALVYGFLVKFRSLLRQSCPLHEYSIEDLEAGLLATSSNACIEEIHASLLSNMLNRKKAVDSQTWQKVLMETLDAKQRTGELEYDVNPLRFYGDYYSIPSPDRIQLLKAMVDWVLQEGAIIRQGIEQDNEYYMVEPFGTDQSRRVYWYFGEGTLRIYRETKSLKKKRNDWETVANNLEELKALADSFNGSSFKAEKALRERIRTEIIEPTEERILQNKLKHERLEKRMQKLAELHQLAATRTTRTRSSNRLNAPKYTFDDEEDDFEDEDDYAIYRRPSSRRRVNNDDRLHGTEESSAQTHDFEQEQEQGEQQEQLERKRSESVERMITTSARSSVGHDSDSSIRVALQRTRVGDAEEDGDDDTSAVSRSDRGRDDSDRDGDYTFEEDHDDDEIASGEATPSVVEVPTTTETTMSVVASHAHAGAESARAVETAESGLDVDMTPAQV